MAKKRKTNRKHQTKLGRTRLSRQDGRGTVREAPPAPPPSYRPGRDAHIPGVRDGIEEGSEGILDRALRVSAPDPTPGTAAELGKLGDWPYIVVRDAQALLDLSEWLQKHGEAIDRVPMGIAVQERELSFATREQGWVVPRYSDLAPALLSVLRKILPSEKTCPALISRDLAADVSMLSEWLSCTDEERMVLAKNMLHDMQSLQYTTGARMLMRSSIQPDMTIRDALDAATAGMMLVEMAPSFYHRVALPVIRQRVRMEWFDAKVMKGTPWGVGYHSLLFRVLGHYTKDPSILGWLRDDQNVMEEWSKVVELPGRQAWAFLLWLCSGDDETVLAKYHLNVLADLPESPRMVKATHIDKKMPTLSLGLIDLKEESALAAKVTTLYGREMPRGTPAEERLHFVLFGAVADILDVAMASIEKCYEHEPSYFYVLPAQQVGTPIELTAVIRGWADVEDVVAWQHTLEQVAKLGHPLIVDLKPKVVVG